METFGMTQYRRRIIKAVRQKLIASRDGREPSEEQVHAEYKRLRRMKRRAWSPSCKRRTRCKRDDHVRMCSR